jgi:hypothetical protein
MIYKIVINENRLFVENDQVKHFDKTIYQSHLIREDHATDREQGYFQEKR